MDALRGSLVDHHLAEIRKHLDIARVAPTHDQRLQKLIDRFSWTDLIASTRVAFDRQGNVDPKARGLRTGPSAELCQEVARGQPEAFDPFHPTVPWSVFGRRDISVAAGGGAYLVESPNAEVEEILRPWSIVAGGVQVLSGLAGNVNIPKEAEGPTGYWLATETTAITEGAPAVESLPLVPRMCGDYIDVSRLLRLTGVNVDRYISSTLLRTIGTLIDVGVVAGTGTAQPQGIIGTVGVGTATGGTLALSHLLAARESVAVANAADDRLVWVAPPAVRKLMAGRERVTNSGRLLWEDDLVDGRRGYQSTAMPAATLLLGDLSKVTLGLWGPGVQVEITDHADQAHFMQGITTMRVLVGCDVAVRQPTAFHVTTAIT